ncbi:MAG: ExeM/NucH family extracellular endonuclease [Acidimicrobiia bacterium]
MTRNRLRLFVALTTIAAVLPIGLAAAVDGQCGELFTPIYDIQGSGDSSPFEHQWVTTEGVVTHDVQKSSELSGFFLQDPVGDGDPATSDGIFVSHRNTWGFDVNVGDHLRITGFVDERFGETQLQNIDVITCDTGVSIAPTVATVPMDFETIEGMLVTFPQTLYISEFFNFDRFGEIVVTTERQYQPSQIAEPGSAKAFAIQEANAANRITIDDNRTSSNPDPAIHPNGLEFTLTNTFRGGDTLTNVTGAISYGFGLFRIQPTTGADYENTNPRPTSPDPIRGDVRVASFNVLNFFTTIDSGPDVCGPTGLSDCRGADNVTEYNRQLAKLLVGIIALDADIVAIQEIESGVRDADGVPDHTAIETLVAELNAIEGPGTWAWIGELDHYNDYPVRNEIIYRVSSVVPVGAPQTIADPAFDSVRPPLSYLWDVEPLGRPPVAQTFHPVGEPGKVFTVVNNHFKSKGSSCASIGDPFDVHQANCNLTRVAQAEALMAFVADLQESTGDPDVLIVGDLNSYANEDPIDRIKLGPDGIQGGGDNFFDLINKPGKNTAYTYLFDGQLGTLDYALASASLLSQVKGVTVFHINADEPDILDYDTSFKKAAQDALFEPLPYRVSDHDPVIVGLVLIG